MNRRAVEKIHSMARLTDRKGYRIEDIYYNGIIRLKANVSISRARFHRIRFRGYIGVGDKFEMLVTDSGRW